MNGSRSEKLSELPAANSVGNSDILYLVSNGISYQVNVQVLAAYILSLANT